MARSVRMLFDLAAVAPGYDAGHNGEPVSACPHKPGTPEHSRWAKEWLSATYIRRELAGEVGRA